MGDPQLYHFCTAADVSPRNVRLVLANLLLPEFTPPIGRSWGYIMKIHEISWSYITVYSNNFIFMASYLIHGSEHSQQTPRGGILLRKNTRKPMMNQWVVPYLHVWISVGLTLCQGLLAGFLMPHPLAQPLKPWDVKLESKHFIECQLIQRITSQMWLICLRPFKTTNKKHQLARAKPEK